MQENLFKPAGLSNTYYDSPTEIISNRVSGYAKDSSKYQNADYISISQAFSAGALLSNVDDLFKWHQALYSYKLVKKEILDKAFTPFKLTDGKLSEYCYGWFIKDWKGSKSIGHGGAIDGFRSMEAYFPDQDVFITTLFNSDADDFSNLFENIADLVLNKQQTSSYKDLKLSDQILDSYIGTYKNDKYNVSIKIYKEKGRLYSDLSNGTGSHMALLAQTETKFFFPDIRRIPTTADFIIENGKVTRLIMTQEAAVEFIKIE